MERRSRKGHFPQKVLVVLFMALAAVLVLAKEKGPDGKELFKEHCKGCHGAGAKAGEYTPMTLIGEQWERFFETKYVPSHQTVADPAHGNRPVTEVITPETLKVLQDWVVDHAADSEHPMTCG